MPTYLLFEVLQNPLPVPGLFVVFVVQFDEGYFGSGFEIGINQSQSRIVPPTYRSAPMGRCKDP